MSDQERQQLQPGNRVIVRFGGEEREVTVCNRPWAVARNTYVVGLRTDRGTYLRTNARNVLRLSR